MPKLRSSTTSKNAKKVYLDSDDNSKEEEEDYVISDGAEYGKEETFKPKKGNRKTKQTYMIDKTAVLDLEEFYAAGCNGGNAESLKEIVAAKDLPLPKHLDNLTFYPYTMRSFDPYNPESSSNVDSNDRKVKVDKKWLLVCSKSSGTLELCHKDQELKVTKATVYVKVPRIIGAPPSFICNRTRRGQLKSVHQTDLSFSFDYTEKTIDEALGDFVTTDAYFKQTFPTRKPDDLYPEDFINIINQTSGKINPGMGQKLISATSTHYLLENPIYPTNKPGISCPDFMEEIDPTWFRVICSDDSKHKPPSLTHFSSVTNIYFDISKFPLLPDKNFKNLSASFCRSFAYQACHLPRASKLTVVQKPLDLKFVSFTSLEASTLSWMKDEIEGGSSENHSISYLDASTIIQLDHDILPGKLVNFRESAVVDHVSAHFLETKLKVYGGIITKRIKKSNSNSRDVNRETPTEAIARLRYLALSLIYKAPLTSIADLHISDFQKNFLIPSKATLIMSDQSSVGQWESLFAEFHAKVDIKLKVVVLDSTSSFKNTTWEDVLFADVVLCAGNLWKDFAKSFNRQFMGYGYSMSEKKFFFQRSGNGIDENNQEPAGLLHMKDKIANIDQWFSRKGSVDLGGVYWHRTIYDLMDDNRDFTPVAADWKWIFVPESEISDSYPNSMLTDSGLHGYDFLAFKNKFLCSITSEKKSLDPPVVLSSISPESSAQKTIATSSVKRKGKEIPKAIATSSVKRKGKETVPVVRNPDPSVPKTIATTSVKRKGKETAPVVRKRQASSRVPLKQENRPTPLAASSSKEYFTVEDGDSDSDADFVHQDSSVEDPAELIARHSGDVIAGSKKSQTASSIVDIDDSPPPSAADQDVFEVDYSEEIDQLVGMGFNDISKCHAALARYDGSVEHALNYLLS